MSLRLEKILISGFIRKTVYYVRLQGGGSVVLKNCQKIVKLIVPNRQIDLSKTRQNMLESRRKS